MWFHKSNISLTCQATVACSKHVLGMCWVAEMSWDSGSANRPVVRGPGTQLIMAPLRSQIMVGSSQRRVLNDMRWILKGWMGAWRRRRWGRKLRVHETTLLHLLKTISHCIWKRDSKCLWEACSSSLCSPLPGVP